MVKNVYNLEFPLNTDSFQIRDYKFYKVDNYQERRQGLQQLVNISDDQQIERNTGTHQHTGYIEIPEHENPSILHQDFNDGTELTDILLLLSLFTGRDVFVLDPSVTAPIIADPRVYPYGGGLRASLQYTSEIFDELSGIQLTKEDLRTGDYLWEERDTTLKDGIEIILDLINTKNWQDLYGDGYYLRLYKATIKYIDPYVSLDVINFLQSWTIWEHIYGLNHRNTLTDVQIYKTSGNKKISFILTEYFNLALDLHAKQEIDRLSKSRNRVVHFGRHTTTLTGNDVTTFMRSTDALIAMTLNLTPSNVLNYKEKLNNLLFA